MTPSSLTLPTLGGGTERYTLGRRPPIVPAPAGLPESRIAYAAAHVVANPMADSDPTSEAAVDWDATLAFRRHLWSLGLGVAEAMDTAQRGMGLDWPAVRELVCRTLRDAAAEGGKVVCGVATDQLVGTAHHLDTVVVAYEEQLAFVEELGGTAVIMASRALAAAAGGPEDYHAVYGRLLSQVSRPVILHWLGEMFDPELAGYWGAADALKASDVLIDIVREHTDAVEGIKISMLDEQLEIDVRRRLPDGVRCYTGDDFNYPALIAGDEQGHSDALLGIFDPIAPIASAALQALDAGDLGSYHDLLGPTVPLSRHIFSTPTCHYKTGVVFLAYLAGHQDHFRMVGGKESARSALHLAELLRLADEAGVLPDPDRAAERARHVFALAGISP